MKETNTDWKLNIQQFLESDSIQSDYYSLETLKYFFSLKKETPQTFLFYFHYEIMLERYNSTVIICIKNQNMEKDYMLAISFPIKSDGKSKIRIPIQLNELLDQNNGWVHDNNSIIFSIKVKIEDLTNLSKQTFKTVDYNLNQYSIVDTFTIINIRKNINNRMSSSYQFGKDDEIKFGFEGKSNPEKKVQLDLFFSKLNISGTFSIYILLQNRDIDDSKMIYKNIFCDPENLRHSFIFDVTESDFNEYNGWIFQGSAQFLFKIANFEFSEFPDKSNYLLQSLGYQTEQIGHHGYMNQPGFNKFGLNDHNNFFSRFNFNFPHGSPPIDPLHNKVSPDNDNLSHELFPNTSNNDGNINIDNDPLPNPNSHFRPEYNIPFIPDLNFHNQSDNHIFPNDQFKNNGLSDITSHFQSNNDLPPISDFNFNPIQGNMPTHEDINIINPIDDENNIGLAGLQNQGATCYLNSAIQLLFHIPLFRKVVYEMKIDENSYEKSDRIALSLQKLFIEMQTNKNSVCSTSDLTNSFGWSQFELITEHDVQEFIRTLIDVLEKKIKGTDLDGEIAKIFRGKICTVVRAPQVKYESIKNEFFYDLPLVVRGSANLEESLKNFLKPEKLTGNNKYVIDNLGPQDAEMHTEFVEFPSVLQIHLKRFEYDLQSKMECKINDRFEFPPTIDLSNFLNEDSKSESNNIYDLYCILVHEGFAQLGHYYAFIRQIIVSEKDEKNWKFNDDLNNWYKFNDSFVTKSSFSEAVVNNYGGSYTEMNQDKIFSAYMIVYVRRDQVVDIMKPISDDEIPQNLQDFKKKLKENTTNQINNEFYPNSSPTRGRPRIIDNWDHFGHYVYDQKVETMEDASFMTEESFFANFTKDFCETNSKEKKFTVKISSRSTIEEIYKAAEQVLKLEEGSFRLWITTGDFKPYKPFYELESCCLPGNFLVQRKEKTDPLQLIKPYIITVFVIFFDISLEIPGQYIGSIVVKKNEPISAIFKFANEKLGFPENNEFLTYKEKGGPCPFYAVDNDYQLKEKAAFIVLQLKKDCQLSKMNSTYKWKTKDDFINVLSPIEPDKTKDELPFYNLIEENRNKLTEASSYFHAIKRYFYIIVHMIKKPDIPLIRIKYSTVFNVSELTDFIAEKLKLKYNRNEDSILLFSNYDESPKINHNFLTTFDDVSIRKEYKYYVQEIKGMNFEAIQKAKSVHTLIALDGYNASLQTRVYIEKDTQVFAVVFYLINQKFLTDSALRLEDDVNKEEEDNEGENLMKTMSLLEQGKIRVYQVDNHVVSSVWDSEEIVPQDTYEIKIDIVPDDQLHLTQTQVLITGSHKHNIKNMTFSYLNPFFFVIDLEERVRDFKERLKKIIHLDDSWESCKIYLGTVELDASKDPIKIQYIYKPNYQLIIFHCIQK